MSDMKFTPGPWSVHNTGDIFTDLGARNAEGIDAPSNDGWHIADCDMGGLGLEELQANAHLIAAAPEIYLALRKAMDFIESHVADPDITEEMSKAWIALEEADPYAALAKARGES